MSLHSAHLSDEVGTLRPDICPDCRAQVSERLPDNLTPLDRAAAAIRAGVDGVLPELDAATRDNWIYSMASDALTAAQLPSRFDSAQELRIANLLAVAAYPTSIGLGADVKRRTALQQALRMLGLDD